LAAELKDAARLKWIFDAYAGAGEIATEEVLELLLESARGWYNIADDVARYLRALEACASSGDRGGRVMDRLRELARS
jgi:hypothetical protein